MPEIENKNWEKLFNQQESVKEKGQEKKELIDNYFFIFDCIENSMLFTNTAFNTITGYDNETFDVNQLIEMIHPDDLDYFFKSEERGLNFTNKLSFSEHFQYVLHYSYKIITKSGETITIQQQCQAIEVNNYGHLGKTLVVHKRIPNYDKKPLDDYKIFDKRLNRFVNTQNHFNLTKRELEIVSLVKEGISSTKIANILNISKYTVDTHRKKILNKTNTNNFMELIKRMSYFEIS